MGRPRLTHARTRTIPVKLSTSDVDALDKARGGTARSAYIRAALTKALRTEDTTRRTTPPISVTETPAVTPTPEVVETSTTHRHVWRRTKNTRPGFRGMKEHETACDCGTTQWVI